MDRAQDVGVLMRQRLTFFGEKGHGRQQPGDR